MMGLFFIWSSIVLVYVVRAKALFREWEEEEERQRIEYIESVGGVDSPWINPNVNTQTHVDVSHIPDMVRVYPQSQMIEYAPESVPEPVPTTRGSNHVNLGGSAVHSSVEPEVMVQSVQPVQVGSADQWLEQNRIYFPLEVPPEDLTNEYEIQAYDEACKWIKKAAKAGISQTKISTEMFGVPKGGSKAYIRVRNLIKGVLVNSD